MIVVMSRWLSLTFVSLIAILGSPPYLSGQIVDSPGKGKIGTANNRVEIDLSIDRNMISSRDRVVPVKLTIRNVSKANVPLSDFEEHTFYFSVNEMARSMDPRRGELYAGLFSMTLDLGSGSGFATNRRNLRPGEVVELSVDLQRIIWNDSISSVSGDRRRGLITVPPGPYFLFFSMKDRKSVDSVFMTSDIYSSNDVKVSLN